MRGGKGCLMVIEPKAGDYVHYTSHLGHHPCVPGFILKSHPFTGERLICFPYLGGTTFKVEARQAGRKLEAGTWHLMNEPGCQEITVLGPTELEGVSLN